MTWEQFAEQEFKELRFFPNSDMVKGLRSLKQLCCDYYNKYGKWPTTGIAQEFANQAVLAAIR